MNIQHISAKAIFKINNVEIPALFDFFSSRIEPTLEELNKAAAIKLKESFNLANKALPEDINKIPQEEIESQLKNVIISELKILQVNAFESGVTMDVSQLQKN